jgi:hypothetical protein
MGAFLRGKGQILWDVTVDTGYVQPMDFLTPRSRDMFDANNKAVDYLFHALCQREVDRVHAEHLACRIWTYTANQRGGSEWEPIKILLGGDGNSNKMNTASNTRLRLTTQVGQAHVATGVPLDLGTNTQPSDPRTQWNTKPRVYRPPPVRPVSTTGQTGPCW